MTDPWRPPGHEEHTKIEGGGPMEVGQLVWADLSSNPVGHFAAGFAYFAAVMLLVLIAVAALGIGLAPGIVMEDETLLVVGGIFGMTVYTVSILLFSFVGFPIMTASLLRNLEDQRLGEGAIGLMSLFDRTSPEGLRIAGFYMLSQLIILVGVLMLYLPGFVAMALTTVAMPIVVLEGATMKEALNKAWAHMAKEPVFHLGTWGLFIGVVFALYFTIIGLLLIFPLMVLWQYYTYKVAFGEEGALAWEP